MAFLASPGPGERENAMFRLPPTWLGFTALLAILPADSPGSTCRDVDGDGICLCEDRCSALAHPENADVDGDGVGDPCDADYNEDGVTSGYDYLRLNACLGTSEADPAWSCADGPTCGALMGLAPGFFPHDWRGCREANHSKGGGSNHHSHRREGPGAGGPPAIDDADLDALMGEFGTAAGPSGQVFCSAQDAFPGAEGVGAKVVGGRGGQVIAVTNLNDSGPGSLRAAIETPGPRTVVFRTGGRIWLDSRIEILEPFLTIAGQTAPGGGIELANGNATKTPLEVRTHQVILRNLRIRPGPGGEPDALTVDGLYGARDVIVDHCSLGWALDENLALVRGADRVTVQWSLLSEALDCSTHSKGCHSKNFLIDGDLPVAISVHHNLLAHAAERHPRIAPPGHFDFVNNVVYNPRFEPDDWGPMHVETSEGVIDPIRVNAVGNTYRPGADSGPADWFADGENAFSIYSADNSVPAAFLRPGDEDHLAAAPPEIALAYPISTESAQDAFDAVLAPGGAGATQALACDGTRLERRDPIDQRIVDDVQNGTGAIIDDPSEVGGYPFVDPGTPCPDADLDGMPDEFETLQGLDPGDPSDHAGDADADGYTNLEEFLDGNP